MLGLHCHAQAFSSCGQRASHCGEFSCCRVQALEEGNGTPLQYSCLENPMEVGCKSMGSLRVDTTERLHFHFSLSCTGEGNGNSLQCSCLENPRGRGAWWAAVYGVTHCRTRLKRLSSSSTGSRFEGLSSCSSRAQLFHSMQDLHGSESKPVSPPLAGGLKTTEPPVKSLTHTSN